MRRPAGKWPALPSPRFRGGRGKRLDAGSGRLVAQRRLIDSVRGAADQDEAAIAIAAIGIALIVDLQIHPRMAQRGPAGNVGGTVARDTAMRDTDGFWRRNHARTVSKPRPPLQSLLRGIGECWG